MRPQFVQVLDAVQDMSGGNVKTPQKEYAETGKFPIVDQGLSLVGGFTDDPERLCKAKPPVIVFGDHTRAVKYVDFPFCMGADGTKVLIPRDGNNPRYLYYALSALDLESAGYSRHFKFLKEKRIPLPPLPEQKRIAKILDAADALRVKRRESLAQLDALVQSTFLEMFGDPVENRKEWQVCTLGDLTNKIGSGATPRGGRDSYKQEGISLVRSLNVHDGVFRWKDLAFIGDEQAAKLDNVVVEADDVLLNITGASVARCCLAPEDVLPARVNQHVAIIRPDSELSPNFLSALLLSPSMKRRLLRIAESGATRQAITKKQIQDLEVIVPPQEMQARFDARIYAIAEQARLRKLSCEHWTDMFKVLQHRAFAGEL